MTKNIFLAVAIIFSVITCKSQTVHDSTRVADSTGEVDDKVFVKVESEADFPGGMKGWIQYLKANLNGATPVNNKAPAGTYQVIVRFIVSKDGKVKNVTAETAHGFGMEAEVIRIISNGPAWLPAMKDGKPVNAYRRQPVTFMVSDG